MKEKADALRPILMSRLSALPDWTKTALIVAVSTMVAALIHVPFHSTENVMIFYILAVVVASSVTTGFRWGMITAVLSVLLTDFLFTPPYWTLQMEPSRAPLTLTIMSIAALATTILTSRVKARAQLAQRRELRAQRLYELTKKLLATRGQENIAAITSDYIGSLFDCDVAFYLDCPDKNGHDIITPMGNAPALSGEDAAAAELAVTNQIASGAGAGTHPKAVRFYMPIVSSQGQTYGAVGFLGAGGTVFAENDMTFLDMAVSQVGMALERQQLSDEQRKITIEAETEKMRSNLLRAISHDLRTPLTGILGASSAILENGSRLTPENHDRLLNGIREDSQWLIRMVENLLSVTRMRDGEGSVTKAPEAVEEIVAEAMARIRARFPDRKLNVKVPDELMMIPMDGTLIEQVLINLVENAIKHSGSAAPIEVTVSGKEDRAIFQVSDHGEGISPEDLSRLFDGYAAHPGVSSDSSRGMGIGLSICNSIVRAHGGEIFAENCAEGGARFTFQLPL